MPPHPLLAPLRGNYKAMPLKQYPLVAPTHESVEPPAAARWWSRKNRRLAPLNCASSPHRPAAASHCENCYAGTVSQLPPVPANIPQKESPNKNTHTKTANQFFMNDKTQMKPPLRPLLHAPHNLWHRRARTLPAGSWCGPPQRRNASHSHRCVVK